MFDVPTDIRDAQERTAEAARIPGLPCRTREATGPWTRIERIGDTPERLSAPRGN
jgi:hypothetical protein